MVAAMTHIIFPAMVMVVLFGVVVFDIAVVVIVVVVVLVIMVVMKIISRLIIIVRNVGIVFVVFPFHTVIVYIIIRRYHLISIVVHILCSHGVVHGR
jgi:hypothetical protein